GGGGAADAAGSECAGGAADAGRRPSSRRVASATRGTVAVTSAHRHSHAEGNRDWEAARTLEADVFPELSDPTALRSALLELISAGTARRWHA
ncbi:MAG TPA: hypothetical protein VFS93_00615, partial [Terrimesophilobacter sp.]|nr:hypothetical protein [Terrimesophilobacter sp.]